jgi:hypothetical protein
VKPNLPAGAEGTSPLLAVACPVCKAAPGKYCKKDDGSRQVIAHKRRSAAFLAAGHTFR